MKSDKIHYLKLKSMTNFFPGSILLLELLPIINLLEFVPVNANLDLQSTKQTFSNRNRCLILAICYEAVDYFIRVKFHYSILMNMTSHEGIYIASLVDSKGFNAPQIHNFAI